MNIEYRQFVFVCVLCVACVHTSCASAWTRCLSTCSLRLNVRMRDSGAEKSRVFPSHTSIPIYTDFTESERPSNTWRYTRLSPPVFEGRYFEVALKFLWSSREQPKIKKEVNLNVGRRQDVWGRSARGDQGFLNVWNKSWYTQWLHNTASSHSPHYCLDTHQVYLKTLGTGELFIQMQIQHTTNM